MPPHFFVQVKKVIYERASNKMKWLILPVKCKLQTMYKLWIFSVISFEFVYFIFYLPFASGCLSRMRARPRKTLFSEEPKAVNYLSVNYLCLAQQLGGTQTTTKKRRRRRKKKKKKLLQWHFLLGWQLERESEISPFLCQEESSFTWTAMDFNVKRLAADAGTFLSRAVQVSETVGRKLLLTNLAASLAS